MKATRTTPPSSQEPSSLGNLSTFVQHLCERRYDINAYSSLAEWWSKTDNVDLMMLLVQQSYERYKFSREGRKFVNTLVKRYVENCLTIGERPDWMRSILTRSAMADHIRANVDMPDIDFVVKNVEEAFELR